MEVRSFVRRLNKSQAELKVRLSKSQAEMNGQGGEPLKSR